MKILFGLIILLLTQFYSLAQSIPGDRIPLPGEEAELLSALKNSTLQQVKYAEALLNMGAYYLYLPGEESSDLEKAMMYAEQARKYCFDLNYQDGYNEAMLLIGNTFREGGQKDFAIVVFDSAIINIKKLKESSKINNQHFREVRAFRQLAFVHFVKEEYVLAEKEFLEIIEMYKIYGYRELHYNYERLSLIKMIEGDFNKALEYGLEMLRSMETTGDYSSAGSFYYDVGYIYAHLGQFQKGINYYNLALDIYKTKHLGFLYDLTADITKSMSKLNRNKEALVLLENIISEYPPINDYQKKVVEGALGNCYRELKMYDKAEIHANKSRGYSAKSTLFYAYLDKTMAQLYTQWGKYEMARPYIEKCLEVGIQIFGYVHMADLYFLMYRVDSAAGNYKIAMNYLAKSKEFENIVFEVNKIKGYQELEIKYDTEKKDKDIKIKEQNIQLLNKETEIQKKNFEKVSLQLQYDAKAKEQSIQLIKSETEKKDKDLLVKQQNIELLKKEGLLQHSLLQQANTSRNMVIGGATMLLLLLILLYNRFHAKQRTSKEINDKNIALQQLVNEKEWLLKEVHHRVKNNLQTVVSLLESQSAYLQDDALLAIQDSQNRVHAMSLIHQKLYQAQNVACISMEQYLPELVNYLRESFSVKSIYFDLQISPIDLDVSQAIPVGLIVNEAITNSIKYAFPAIIENKKVTIILSQRNDGHVVLGVSDNGVGIPKDFSGGKTGSLGLKLIKGLTEDLNGQFSIQSEKGTSISILFTANKPLHKVNLQQDSTLVGKLI